MESTLCQDQLHLVMFHGHKNNAGIVSDAIANKLNI